jgi:uncharacterized protein DUF805
MIEEDDDGASLPYDALPIILRYREHALRSSWVLVGLLLAAAFIAIIALRHPIFGAPFAVIAIGYALPLIWIGRHVRRFDHLRVEAHVLVLNYRNGKADRLPLTPSVEFVVRTEHMFDMLVMTSAADQHTRKRFVAFDLLDLLEGHSVHDLCDLLNQLCTAGVRVAASPWSVRRPGTQTIRRRLDWYRNPRRISRGAYLLGVLVVATLCIAVFVSVSSLLAPFGLGLEKGVGMIAKLILAFLVAHPALKYLAVARLRDIGESANHRNVGGLVWKTTSGPLRLFLAKGEPGANEFGLEPRF